MFVQLRFHLTHLAVLSDLLWSNGMWSTKEWARKRDAESKIVPTKKKYKTQRKYTHRPSKQETPSRWKPWDFHLFIDWVSSRFISYHVHFNYGLQKKNIRRFVYFYFLVFGKRAMKGLPFATVFRLIPLNIFARTELHTLNWRWQAKWGESTENISNPNKANFKPLEDVA